MTRAVPLALALGCTSALCPPDTAAVQVGAVSVCATQALTAADRLQGLRGRDHLEALLLRFPVESELCLVNDGVSVDVTAVFIQADGRVSALLDLPAGDATVRCGGPARDVLELTSPAPRPAVGDRAVLP